MKDWQRYTSSSRYVLINGGDHYLVHGKAKEATQVILEDLAKYLELPSELTSSGDSGSLFQKIIGLLRRTSNFYILNFYFEFLIFV